MIMQSHSKEDESMIEMTPDQMLVFLRRSYTAVDGLWFVKAEDRYGFDTALEIDEEVWKVFPKIQVRMLKALGGAERGCLDLWHCLSTKLALESFQFQADEIRHDSVRISISECPWHALMLKSGRASLSGKVGTRICRTEYTVWAAEFGCRFHFDDGPRICTGGESCLLRFSV